MTILTLVRLLLEYHENYGDLECMVDIGRADREFTPVVPTVTKINKSNQLPKQLAEDKDLRKVVWL